jgi:hypothetical protein
MEALAFLAPFIPFFAMLPPALAAMWIANRWLKSREGRAGLDAELGALREELAALRQSQAELQERLDFTERMLSQVREARRDLPRASAEK